MVFGVRKEYRAPDLSRYDYYYENLGQNYNKSNRLSREAASASLYHRQNQTKRTQSLTNESAYVQNVKKFVSANKGKAIKRKDATRRSNSMVNQPMSRTNSITTQITKVKDQQGRTKSITKRTVKRINGYEYIETVTTTTDVKPLKDGHAINQDHFNEFSDNFIRDEASNVIEEEDEEPEVLSAEAFAPDMNNPYLDDVEDESFVEPRSERHVNRPSTPLDQISSVSKFSDAKEYINQTPVRKTEKVPNKKVVQRRVQREPQRRSVKPMSEQEMYLHALEVAKQKVYQNGYTNEKPASQPKKSVMGKRMTLRSPQQQQQQPVRKASTPQPVKKIPTPQPQSNKLSDEEMYAKALEIAQKRYNESHDVYQRSSEEFTMKQHENIEKKIEDVELREKAAPVLSTKDTTPNNIPSSSTSNNNGHNKYDSLESNVHTMPSPLQTSNIAPEPRLEPISRKQTSGSNSTSHHSKFRSMFDKIVQFSNENSGYQPSKKEKMRLEEELPEITTVASSHGATTTLPVEQALSVSSFTRQNRPSTVTNQTTTTSIFTNKPEVISQSDNENEPVVKKASNGKKGKTSFITKLFRRHKQTMTN
ncbi:hypothetical protein KAFR_0H01730 [Kazachstania africana CBS 2517]|uniref:Meiotic sister-chromatid recombination protein 3 n=1 Tax=Kazachstania africana (strain ATCC 22294 / BCRC 22015 / CBS 2517 / CECT 1963 / NBRC 1671 / NRRL Y-8276) TaxID=1071382 RepID=H2AZ27_KAZAF|nr:hypothetical protein KAFR_0H01730 [Kazachstania africana CBS 2517]CCF59583.1 hypothetical protein KAFR_0H01730 [Kazachstania africana CBS 2517]